MCFIRGKKDVPAYASARLAGSWWYVCRRHFREFEKVVGDDDNRLLNPE
ncbi:hypothetical protein C6A87_024530 [Mycobacterium sp. ITM-2016-00317]|nr:hypothetical protein [Mycobacterium sp. ITM-2016-00317]WNG86924.1 hypothetical protein C6A87_024530 [Mycobacterium sp. ITM-2016-00317]